MDVLLEDVIGIIFSFLDEHWIRNKGILVCKKWKHVAERYPPKAWKQLIFTSRHFYKPYNTTLGQAAIVLPSLSNSQDDDITSSLDEPTLKKRKIENNSDDETIVTVTTASACDTFAKSEEHILKKLALPRYSHVEKVLINSPLFTDLCLELICNNLHYVTELALDSAYGSVNFKTSTLFMITELKHLRSLRLIHFSNVTDDLVDHISLNLKKLKLLDLTESYHITDKVCKSIADNLPSLEQLSLQYCSQITDEGLRNLQRCKDMEILNLSICPRITGAGVSKLVQELTRLKKLDVRHCKEIDRIPLSNVITKESSANLWEWIDGMSSNESVKTCIRFFRSLLASPHPPISEVVHTGLVPKFIQLLKSEDPDIQYEATWVLTNIGSGKTEDTNTVVEYGAVPVLFDLLQSQSAEVRDQVPWALGNIIGDSNVENRDMILRRGIMKPLLSILMNETRLVAIQNAMWALANLGSHKPSPNFQYFEPCLPTITKYLGYHNSEVKKDACRFVLYLSRILKGAHRLKLVEAGMLEPIVNLLRHSSSKVKENSSEILYRLSKASRETTEKMIDLGVIAPAGNVLASLTRKKYCMKLITSMCSYGPELIQPILESNILKVYFSQANLIVHNDHLVYILKLGTEQQIDQVLDLLVGLEPTHPLWRVSSNLSEATKLLQESNNPKAKSVLSRFENKSTE